MCVRTTAKIRLTRARCVAAPLIYGLTAVRLFPVKAQKNDAPLRSIPTIVVLPAQTKVQNIQSFPQKIRRRYSNGSRRRTNVERHCQYYSSPRLCQAFEGCVFNAQLYAHLTI